MAPRKAPPVEGVDLTTPEKVDAYMRSLTNELMISRIRGGPISAEARKHDAGLDTLCKLEEYRLDLVQATA